MGCDIHLCVEVKKDGQWVSVDKWTTVPPNDDEDGYTTVDYDDRFYSGRNYVLFGVLAGVRVNDVPQIAPLRGLPLCTSPEVTKYFKGWGNDIHSLSVLSLRELLAYDWGFVVRDYDGPESLKSICASFCDRTIPKLKALGNPEDVRIVFGFDN